MTTPWLMIQHYRRAPPSTWFGQTLDRFFDPVNIKNPNGTLSNFLLQCLAVQILTGSQHNSELLSWQQNPYVNQESPQSRWFVPTLYKISVPLCSTSTWFGPTLKTTPVYIVRSNTTIYRKPFPVPRSLRVWLRMLCLN